MSGESYGWLHVMDLEQLLNHENDLERMVDDAAKRVGHYAPDFTQALQSILLRVRAARILVEGEIDALSGAMRAFNWWQSGDSDEAGFKESLEAWRKGK